MPDASVTKQYSVNTYFLAGENNTVFDACLETVDHTLEEKKNKKKEKKKYHASKVNSEMSHFHIPEQYL